MKKATVSASRRVANAPYTLLCWQIGSRLPRDNLQAGRAADGKQILATASQELTAEFGAGFNYTALTRMARFTKLMRERLHQAMEHAREQAARRLPDAEGRA
jgi:hypothetical protein